MSCGKIDIIIDNDSEEEETIDKKYFFQPLSVFINNAIKNYLINGNIFIRVGMTGESLQYIEVIRSDLIDFGTETRDKDSNDFFNIGLLN